MKKIFLVAFNFLIVCVLALFISLIALNFINQAKEIIQINYDKNSEVNALTIEEFEEMEDNLSLQSTSFTSERPEIFLENYTVTPVLTNEFIDENNLTISYGCGFSEDDIANKENVVIISDDLALKLCRNENAVGQIFRIEYTEYTVCGVYKTSDALINKICKDIKERIYIPCTTVECYWNYDIDTVTYPFGSKEAVYFEQMNLPQYYSVDFSEKINVIETLNSIGYILIEIFIFLVCIITLKNAFIKQDIKEKSRVSKADSIKIFITKNYRRFIFAFCLLTVGIMMIVFCKFSFYIIPDYLPEDNIFDLIFYTDKLVENAKEINSLALSGESYLLNLYIKTFTTMTALLVLLAVTLIRNLLLFCRSYVTLNLFKNRTSPSDF